MGKHNYTSCSLNMCPLVPKIEETPKVFFFKKKGTCLLVKFSIYQNLCFFLVYQLHFSNPSFRDKQSTATSTAKAKHIQGVPLEAYAVPYHMLQIVAIPIISRQTLKYGIIFVLPIVQSCVGNAVAMTTTGFADLIAEGARAGLTLLQWSFEVGILDFKKIVVEALVTTLSLVSTIDVRFLALAGASIAYPCANVSAASL